MSQIATENDKKPKTFHFQWFYAFFPQFLTHFVNWNVENDLQGKQVLSSELRKEINEDFQTKTVRN